MTRIYTRSNETLPPDIIEKIKSSIRDAVWKDKMSYTNAFHLLASQMGASWATVHRIFYRDRNTFTHRIVEQITSWAEARPAPHPAIKHTRSTPRTKSVDNAIPVIVPAPETIHVYNPSSRYKTQCTHPTLIQMYVCAECKAPHTVTCTKTPNLAVDNNDHDTNI